MKILSRRGTEGRAKHRDEGDVADASAGGEPLHRFEEFRLLPPGAKTHASLRLEVTLEAARGHGVDY